MYFKAHTPLSALDASTRSILAARPLLRRVFRRVRLNRPGRIFHRSRLVVVFRRHAHMLMLLPRRVGHMWSVRLRCGHVACGDEVFVLSEAERPPQELSKWGGDLVGDLMFIVTCAVARKMRYGCRAAAIEVDPARGAGGGDGVNE